MADETIQTPAAPAPAEAQPEQTAAPLRALREYVVQHHIMFGHPGVTDGVQEFHAGDVFPSAGVLEEHIKALRAAGAIKLREEVEKAEEIARRRIELEQENAALKAKEQAMQDELEKLRAQVLEQAKALPAPGTKAAK